MSSSGYLDDEPSFSRPDASSSHNDALRSRTELLMASMNKQPWHRTIRPSTHMDDVDSDEDEKRARRRRRQSGRRRHGARSVSSSSDTSANTFSSWDSDEADRRAQQEWDESVAQLQLVFQVMLLPFVGKWVGRKWAYWAFARYQHHGLTSRLFGLDWLWAPTTIIPGSAVAALQP